MGARFNWILHFGLPPRYNKDVRVVQLDINPESMHQNKPAEVALVGDGKAIVAQLNQALRAASGSTRKARRGARRSPRKRPRTRR